MSEKIDFEEVTIKVPKAVMSFLRIKDPAPVEWIEHVVLDNVRAEVEAMQPTEWKKIFKLEPTFLALI